MHAFAYTQPADIDAAVRAGAASPTAQQGASVRFLAGGTTLVDLMKLDVETPATVVDINRLGLDAIDDDDEGGLKIGALVRNSDLARDPRVLRDHAVLSQALLSGASGQLRNMATTAGNLLQRTRCMYFRDVAHPCNKRTPGSGCPAIQGANRMLAVLGTSEHCVATNPSDMNIALAALEATVHIHGTNGARSVAIADFFLPPGDTPHVEHVLAPGDLVTHVRLPAPVPGARSHYLKLRDRASYEFALMSAAVVVAMDGDRIGHVRVAMGGLGTVPWRMREAEALLAGQAPSPALFARAGDAALADARPLSHNGFKPELAGRCLAAALAEVTRP